MYVIKHLSMLFMFHDIYNNLMRLWHIIMGYRRIHHVKFWAFHGNQLEYNGSQGANGAG